jgi:hypothetical protein
LYQIFERHRYKIVLYFGIFLFLYILFPSHNNSGDAWSMAADAKFGHELFSPHHLLYTINLYLLAHLVKTSVILELGILMNAVAGWFCLIVLYQVLNLLSQNHRRVLYLMAIAALSFGFWRYTTENEVYIIPVLFSLLGSYFYIKAIIKRNYSTGFALLSGLFATMACLYHQIHIFWFIGLAIGWLLFPAKNRVINCILFSLTFSLAAIAYLVVIRAYLHLPITIYNILHFTFHDYYTGAAGNKIGASNFILGIINFVRTFIQVHGQIYEMVSKNVFWLMPAIISAFLFFCAIILIFRDRKKFINDSVAKQKKIFVRKLSLQPSANNQPLTYIFHTHLLVFLLQLAFAVYNIGNAEFMVMLPVLLVIILAASNQLPTKSLALSALGLLIWNFCYGIYPDNKLHFNADDKVTQFIIEHPKDIFIVAEPAIVFNQYYYREGHWPQNAWAGPEYYPFHAPLKELVTRIDSVIINKGVIYSDCQGRPVLKNRASMLMDNDDFFFYQKPKQVARFKTDAGDHIIYKYTEWTGKYGLHLME